MEPQGAEGIEPDTPVLCWGGERNKHNALRYGVYAQLHVIYPQIHLFIWKYDILK